MKTFCGFSCCLTLAIFFAIGTRKYVLAEEKCPDGGQHSRLMDHQDMVRTPDDLLKSIMWPFFDYYRPWTRMLWLSKDQSSTIKTDKDKFQINLDVQHFAPDEISVKTADGYVVIEAKHEEKQDEHGFVSRQFVRRYSLPEGTESEDVVSELSSDGILTVSAPRKEIAAKGERVVPISQTGPVRRAAEDAKDSQGVCENGDKSCAKV